MCEASHAYAQSLVLDVLCTSSRAAGFNVEMYADVMSLCIGLVNLVMLSQQHHLKSQACGSSNGSHDAYLTPHTVCTSYHLHLLYFSMLLILQQTLKTCVYFLGGLQLLWQ